jgi:hypothetical protein
MRSRLPLFTLALAATFALAGCTASASLTVPADSVATEAANALEAQIGTLPEIDCGDDAVKLINGTVVDCILTDPATGSQYDAPVTISGVDGLKYKVNVQVAETPIEGSEGSEGETDTDDTATGPSVLPSQLATTAAGALEEQYGALPLITCPGSGMLDLYVGFTIDCDLTETVSQAKGIATITITAVDGDKYSIDVTVVDA